MQTVMILAPMFGAFVVVLVVALVVIKRLVMGDTVKAVARIQQVEAEVRKKEEAIRREIEEHEKEFTRKKTEAETALQQQKEASEKEVAALRDQVLGDAKKEGERILSQAKRNEEKLRQQVLQEMEGKAVDYGAEMFKLVFSEVMNEHLNRQFIGELLTALEEVDADSLTVDAADVQFTTSHPMDPEQKQQMQTLLKEKFGVEVAIQETVKPELLGGIVFKLGSLEIDGTLLNRFQEAIVEVKKHANV